MSKDKDLKRVFDEKFDINEMRKEILYKTEKKEKYNINKKLKYCLPILLVALIFSLSLTSKNDKKKLITNESQENLDTIHINNINDMAALRYDADVKTLNNIDISKFDTLESLDIPKDINNSTYSAVYVKNVNDEKNFYDDDYYTTSSNNYDKLNNYAFNYKNSSNDRNILISFSDTNKPLRDYHFDKIGKQSKINNTNLTIYKYENLYMTEFTYQNVNYDIETSNVSEEELINLLKSIVK